MEITLLKSELRSRQVGSGIWCWSLACKEIPHPDWEQWFMLAQGEIPPAVRFAAVDFPTHELNANAALAGGGVALLSPTLFGSLLTQGLLVAPFHHVLSGPAWHYALLRTDDRRMAPRQFCAWLQEQSGSPP